VGEALSEPEAAGATSGSAATQLLQSWASPLSRPPFSRIAAPRSPKVWLSLIPPPENGTISTRTGRLNRSRTRSTSNTHSAPLTVVRPPVREPAKTEEPPQALARDENGRLGKRPPRAAQEQGKQPGQKATEEATKPAEPAKVSPSRKARRSSKADLSSPVKGLRSKASPSLARRQARAANSSGAARSESRRRR
jgi:hypothetical protein